MSGKQREPKPIDFYGDPSLECNESVHICLTKPVLGADWLLWLIGHLHTARPLKQTEQSVKKETKKNRRAWLLTYKFKCGRQRVD